MHLAFGEGQCSRVELVAFCGELLFRVKSKRVALLGISSLPMDIKQDLSPLFKTLKYDELVFCKFVKHIC
jgi:hypothetical protein